MAGLAKLLAKLRQSPHGVTFDELVRVLKASGWEQVRTAGSHCIFRRTDGSGLPLTIRRPSSGHVAPGAVRDVLAVVAPED